MDIRKLKVKIPPPIEQMLIELEEKGYDQDEAIKAGIRMLYRKECPPYNTGTKRDKASIDAMTNEEYATEVMGGDIFDSGGGIMKVRIIRGNNEYLYPLNSIKSYRP